MRTAPPVDRGVDHAGFVDAQVDRHFIATERIVTLGVSVRLGQSSRSAGVSVVVEDHLPIQLVK
jgi:hypothetical protein